MDFSSSINEITELQTSLQLVQQERHHLLHNNLELLQQTNHLSEELTDLKRLNASLTDENESFQLLLGERTLSGQILGQGVFGQSWDDEMNTSARSSPDLSRRTGFSSSPLIGVLEEDDAEEEVDSGYLESSGRGSLDSGAVAADTSGYRRRNVKSSAKVPTVGLDLAAELDRANEEVREEEDEQLRVRRGQHGREASTASFINMNEDGVSIPLCLSIIC